MRHSLCLHSAVELSVRRPLQAVNRVPAAAMNAKWIECMKG